MTIFKIGNKVRTRFKLRGCKRRGVLEKIDGANYYVRLKQGNAIIELYNFEIEKY